MSMKPEPRDLNESNIELDDLTLTNEQETQVAGGLGITPHWQVEKLRHRPWTLHKAVDNPDM